MFWALFWGLWTSLKCFEWLQPSGSASGTDIQESDFWTVNQLSLWKWISCLGWSVSIILSRLFEIHFMTVYVFHDTSRTPHASEKMWGPWKRRESWQFASQKSRKIQNLYLVVLQHFSPILRKTAWVKLNSKHSKTFLLCLKPPRNRGVHVRALNPAQSEMRSLDNLPKSSKNRISAV